MKLSSLTLHNFLAHAQSTLDLSHPITVVAGRNGSGKTSIGDGIKYALCGRCRSTDAAGRGADQLVRRGAEGMYVGLSLFAGDNLGWVLGRGSHGPHIQAGDGTDLTGKPADARLDILLGAPRDLVEAVLDAPSWFSLPAARQSELLSGILKVSYSHAEIEREARALGLSDSAVMALVGGLARMAAGRESYGPPILEALYASAYEKRAAAKKNLKDLEAKAKVSRPATIPTDEEVTAAADLVRQIESTIGHVRETIGGLREPKRRRDETINAITETEGGLTRARQVGRSPASSPQLSLSSSVEDLAAQIADLERTQIKLAEDLQAARDARKDYGEVVARMEERILAIEQGKIECPSIHAPAVCPLSEAQLAEERGKLPHLKKALHKEKSEFTKLAAAHRKAQEALDACDHEIRQLSGKRQQAREAQARTEGGNAAELEALEERLAMQQADLDGMGDAQTELSAAESRLFGLQRDLTEARAAGEAMLAAQKAASEADTLSVSILESRGKVELLEELCRVLDPRSLPALLLAQKAAPVLEQINAQLSRMAPDYSVGVHLDKGLVLDVLRKGTDGPLPIENLSSSERLRIGVALAFSLSILSGLKILVIDNADILDQSNRDLLVHSFAPMLEAGIESIVVIATQDEPRTLARDGLGSYWVESGRVSDVVGKAQEVVA